MENPLLSKTSNMMQNKVPTQQQQLLHLQQQQRVAMTLAQQQQQKARIAACAHLHYSCAAGDIKLAEAVLQLGLNVDTRDKNGNTALHWASVKGQANVMALLVEKYRCNLNIQNDDGSTSLFLTVREGYLNLVRFLLQNGADPNIKNSQGQTCMHVACTNGRIDIAQLLFECGSWLEIEDNEGDTPLHYAVREGRHDVVEWLLKNGANISHENEDEETPVDLAEEFGDQQMLNLFHSFSNSAESKLVAKFDAMDVMDHSGSVMPLDSTDSMAPEGGISSSLSGNWKRSSKLINVTGSGGNQALGMGAIVFQAGHAN